MAAPLRWQPRPAAPAAASAAAAAAPRPLRRRGPRAAATAASASTSAAVPQQQQQRAHLLQVVPPPTLQQYDDFELLWLEHRRGLSLGKGAAEAVLEAVQTGALPCDAELLRERAQRFCELGGGAGGGAAARQSPIGRLDARRALNAAAPALLALDAGELREKIEATLRLLPPSGAAHATQVVLGVAADLDLPAELLALQYQELGQLFRDGLGSQITPAPLHHLLGRLRSQQQQQQQQQQQAGQQLQQAGQQLQQAGQQLQAGEQQQRQRQASSPFMQVLVASEGVAEQLGALAGLLGPEVAHAAVAACPELLDAPPERAAGSLAWAQRQLQLSPAAALLLAGQCGRLLLMQEPDLSRAHGDVCHLLRQLVGWRPQQVTTALANAPALLTREGAELAAAWRRVQRLSRRRLRWVRELAGAAPALVQHVLLASGRRQLLALQYAADSGDLAGRGLGQVLALGYVDLVTACPGFRAWRALAPGRWCFAGGGGGGADEGGGSGDRGGSGGGAGQARGRVLSVDGAGRPVLVQLGPLGPYDRLA